MKEQDGRKCLKRESLKDWNQRLKMGAKCERSLHNRWDPGQVDVEGLPFGRGVLSTFNESVYVTHIQTPLQC